MVGVYHEDIYSHDCFHGIKDIVHFWSPVKGFFFDLSDSGYQIFILISHEPVSVNRTRWNLQNSFGVV